MLTAIEMFTGKQLKAEIVEGFIKNPANAINLQFDAHYSMERDIAWGIEAKLIDNEVRIMSLCGVADPDMT
jgi:hypothetical protein